jgi:hypothetical protein
MVCIEAHCHRMVWHCLVKIVTKHSSDKEVCVYMGVHETHMKCVGNGHTAQTSRRAEGQFVKGPKGGTCREEQCGYTDSQL